MQVSGISGSSSAWAVRELFPPPQSTAQNLPSAGQSMPSKPSAANLAVGDAQISTDMLGALMQMQTSTQSDMATSMISDLDADGDGALSIEEVASSGTSAASEAFAALDSDGDGSLTATELSSALDAMGPPPGGPPPSMQQSSSDAATSVLDSLDADDDGALSLSEILSALDTDEDSTSTAFSSSDADADGKLSLAELTAVFDRYNTARLTSSGESISTQA